MDLVHQNKSFKKKDKRADRWKLKRHEKKLKREDRKLQKKKEAKWEADEEKERLGKAGVKGKRGRQTVDEIQRGKARVEDKEKD